MKTNLFFIVMIISLMITTTAYTQQGVAINTTGAE